MHDELMSADDDVLELMRRLAAPAQLPLNDRQLVENSGFWDETWYAASYPENWKGDLLGHFLTIGGLQGRSPSADFDSKWYLDAYSDVALSRCNPLVHYLRFGAGEGRHPQPQEVLDRRIIRKLSLFDSNFYLAGSPELKGRSPLDHYLELGWLEGRRPSPIFDGREYLRAYPDVARSGMNPLLHYVRHGRFEGRLPAGHWLEDLEKNRVRDAMKDFRKFDPFAFDSISKEPLGEILVERMIFPSAVIMKFGELARSLGHCDIIAFIPELRMEGAAWRSVPPKPTLKRGRRIAVIATRGTALDLFGSLYPDCTIVGLGDELSFADKVSLVEFLIYALRPLSTVNINSEVGWEAFKRRSVALKHMTRLYSVFPEAGEAGLKSLSSFGSALRECCSNLERVYFGDQRTIEACLATLSVPFSLASRFSMIHFDGSR